MSLNKASGYLLAQFDDVYNAVLFMEAVARLTPSVPIKIKDALTFVLLETTRDMIAPILSTFKGVHLLPLSTSDPPVKTAHTKQSGA